MKRHDLNVWTVLFLALLAVFFGAFLFYPVSFMLRRGFGLEGEFTLKYFSLLFASPLQREAFLNSVSIATLTVIVTSLLVLPMAHWLTKFQFTGRSLLSSLLLVPMIMPPFVGAIGLKQLLARYGSLNLFLMDLGVMDPAKPVDWLGAGGFWGVVILQVLNLYPILFLNVSAAMANVDPTLREAASNLGSTGWQLFRRVTLPLITPGWFAGAIIVWIWAFTDLGTPLIVGFSRVVPVQIFDAVNDLNTNPQGYALVLVVLLLTMTLFLTSKRVLASKSYATIARGHTAGAEVRASRGQTALIWAAGAALMLVALTPHLTVIVSSLADRWFFTVLPESWTTGHFGDVFGHGLTASSIRNSLFYASLSAFVDLILGVLIAWLLTRKKVPFAGVLDALAMLPLALPGLVLAFGYFAGFDVSFLGLQKWLNGALDLGLAKELFEPAYRLANADWPAKLEGGQRLIVWLAEAEGWVRSWLDPRVNPTFLLIVSYSVRRLPYIVRSAYAGFQQTSVTLEEASANLGASPLRTLRKITLPLVAANLVAGSILTFSFAMLEVSDSLILAQREQFFPITKQIWQLMGRIDPSAPFVACALGVVGMGILVTSLLLAGKLMGKKMGQMFRA